MIYQWGGFVRSTNTKMKHTKVDKHNYNNIQKQGLHDNSSETGLAPSLKNLNKFLYLPKNRNI